MSVSATIAICLAMSLPGLMPRWSHVVCGAVASTVIVGITAVWFFRDLANHPSGGDGPAFFGAMFLVGVAQIVLAASVLGHVLAHRLARTLSPTARRRTTLALIGISPAAPILSLLMHLASLAGPQLIGLTAVLSFPLIWLGLALQLAPNSLSKPTPLRGAA